MKVLKYIALAMAGLFMLQLMSCIDEDRKGGRFPDFLEAVNMRIVADPEFSAIDADNPSAAKVVLNFYSENVGDVESVDLYVDFFDFSEGTTSSKAFLKTVPVGNFSEGILKNFEIPLNDFKTALGLKDEDLDGLDQLTIYNETTMKDGRVYPSTITVNDTTSFINVTPNITNSSGTTSFTSTIVVFVQCPLPDGFATGKYKLEQLSGPDDPFFGNPTRWGPGEVTLTAAGSIQRTFTGKYFTFDVPFSFVVTCGSLVVPKGDSGLSCGGPSFTWIQDGINTYDDDSEFIITLIDNVDGACGLPASEPLTLKLTKL